MLALVLPEDRKLFPRFADLNASKDRSAVNLKVIDA